LPTFLLTLSEEFKGGPFCGTFQVRCQGKASCEFQTLSRLQSIVDFFSFLDLVQNHQLRSACISYSENNNKQGQGKDKYNSATANEGGVIRLGDKIRPDPEEIKVPNDLSNTVD
jgi:hypothetical protein